LDPITAELVDAHSEVPRAVVVTNLELHDPDITLPSDLPKLEARGGGVVTPPFAEVLNSLKALSGLRELEDGIVVVDAVSGQRDLFG
jgi:hypothetical protein